MPDYAIGAVSAATPSFYVDALKGTAAEGGAITTSGASFDSVLSGVQGAGGVQLGRSAQGIGDVSSVGGIVDSLQGLQTKSADLAVRAVTGDLTDVHDYTIAAAEASTAMELTAAVRNKAVEAFNEILRMQA